MSTLFFYAMKYNAEKPRDPNNDRFILSKVGIEENVIRVRVVISCSCCVCLMSDG